MRRTLKEFTGPALSPGSWWRQCPAGYHSFAHLDRRWWTGGTGLPAPASWSVQSERITLGREMALSSGAELWSEPLPEGDWVVDSTCWCLQRPHLPDRSWEKPAPMAGHSGLDLMWRKTPKESLGAGWLSGASPQFLGEVGSAPMIPPQRAASPGRQPSYSLKHGNKAFWENAVRMRLNGPAVNSQLGG